METAKFNHLLDEGHQHEDLFANSLNSLGYVRTITSQQYGKVSGWDVSSAACDVCPTEKFEVKQDKMSANTGNVAIELEGRDNKGTVKLSGLSATTSNKWVFSFPDLKDFYVIDTVKLRQLISNKIHHRTLWGGFKALSHIALIKRETFISHCDTIPKYTSSNTGLPTFQKHS